jgi:hypothetical protein
LFRTGGPDAVPADSGMRVTFEDDPFGVDRDPRTCDEAAASRSYVGCDYWPTVVANGVWSIFDFAAIVANAGSVRTTVKVTGPGGLSQETSVEPGQLATIYLPWAHVLRTSKPSGAQVLGYGARTSYQYPGGLELHPIAPPPPVK